MHRGELQGLLGPAAAVGPSVMGWLQPGFEGQGGLDWMVEREGERHSRSPRPRELFGAAASALEMQLHPDPEVLPFNRPWLTDVHNTA